MDDEDIYERFEISDYDIANEFNVNRGRRPTKEQQIYGIWAAEEDEEDEERSKNDKKESKGISFVTGKSAPSKIEKDEDDEDLGRSSFSSAAPQWKRPSEEIDQFSGFRHEKSKLRAFDSKFCEFEKNTRGIGSKLLFKMGFEPGRWCRRISLTIGFKWIAHSN